MSNKQFWMDEALSNAASLMVALNAIGLDDAVDEVLKIMESLVDMGAKS